MDVVALDALTAPPVPCVVALGFFDGLHLGHQRIIATTVERARTRGVSATLFTFRDHPMRVLRPAHAPPALTTFDEKIEVLQGGDLDRTIWCEFTEAFSRQSPETFVRDVVLGRMGAVGVVAGPNYHFGEGARGNVGTLRDLGARMGFEVEIVPVVEVDIGRVSSTRVRALVAEGALGEAARLLGRLYRAQAEVVHGDGRGRTIGYPTANLALPPEKLVPADGVYAVRLRVGDAWYGGVANIGVRPTFGQHHRVFEVYLLDFAGDLYGAPVEVELVRRLRGEMRFDNVGALVAQIGRDVERARAVLTG